MFCCARRAVGLRDVRPRRPRHRDRSRAQGRMRLRGRTPRGQDPCRGAAAPRRETTRRPSVIEDVIARWHRYLGGQLPGGLDQLLSDDVVFFSPVVYTPQQGKRLAIQYLEAASRALAGEVGADGAEGAEGAFHYTKQVLAGDTAVLEFETSVDGKYVNGVDIIRCDDAGRIVEFRVMMRPLQGIQAVHEQMGRRLAAPSGADGPGGG